MDISLLTDDHVQIKVLDTFVSFIWTDRFWEAGDFEIVVPASHDLVELITDVKYVYIPLSEHLMILEDIQITYDADNGECLILRGSSLEKILKYRVTFGSTILLGNLQDEVEMLLVDHLMNPVDDDRWIPGFDIMPTSDPLITNLSINAQFNGMYVYDIIVDLCKKEEIGFKVTLQDNLTMDFELYAGVDRTRDNVDENAMVIFSPNYDNLLNADHTRSTNFLRTHAYVEGEALEGEYKTGLYIEKDPTLSLTGLDRREIFYASSASRRAPDGSVVPEDEYLLQLYMSGVVELAKWNRIDTFDGEIDPRSYIFGVDFDMGDIIQIEDSHRHQTRKRVTAITYSEDVEGMKIFPIFTQVSEEA